MFQYSITLKWSLEDEGYIATIAELPGVSAFGKTPEKAVSEVKVAAELCIETLKEEGKAPPLPSYLPDYSGQLRLRMPKTLHQRLSELAEEEGVSLNSQILSFVSEKLGESGSNPEFEKSLSF